jgi:hypothetical protein
LPRPDSEDTSGFTAPDHPWNHFYTSEKRLEMRNALSEGIRIARPATRKQVFEAEEFEEPVAPDMYKQWLNEIDRIIRFNVFLTHRNINAHQLIDTIMNNELPWPLVPFYHQHL